MKALKTVGTILKNDIFKKTTNNKKITRTIIGIDPGLKNLGIGIIKITTDNKIASEIKKKRIIYDTKSRIKTIQEYSYMLFKIKTQRKIEEKLLFIFDNVCKIFEEYKPDLIMIEDAFVGINKNSGLKLGIVRGCILTAIGKYNVVHKAISPSQIKLQITNKGDATKEDIQNIFAELLPNWPKSVAFDSSDALAAALCGIL